MGTRLIGLVDYDPSGELSALSFRKQVERSSLEVSELVTLIEPRHYSKEKLRPFKFPLSRGQKTKTEAWLEKTGGIDGERYDLESESMLWSDCKNW